MKYFLCNKCGASILFVPEGEGSGGMCVELIPVRTSGICGGSFTIELVPKMESVNIGSLIGSHPQSVATAVDYIYGIPKLHKKRTRFFASMKKIKLTPVMAMRKAYQLREIDKEILILKKQL